MSAHALRRQEPGRLARRRPSSNGLFVLGWGQFWLLSGILGALLSLFGVILLVHLLSL